MGELEKHKKLFKKVQDKMKSALEQHGEIQRDKAVNLLEKEVEELDHIFALLTIGFMQGLPSPPLNIPLSLLPQMEKELLLMLNKSTTAMNPLSDLFSNLEVG